MSARRIRRSILRANWLENRITPDANWLPEELATIRVTEHDVATGMTRELDYADALTAAYELVQFQAEAKSAGFTSLTAALQPRPDGLLPPKSPPVGEIDASQPQLATIFGADGRTRVNPTTGYPWSTQAQIAANWSDGSWSWGSAVTVSPYHLLTAAHCVRKDSAAGGAFASTFRAAMANNGDQWGPVSYANALQSTDRYFGEANATYFRSYSWSQTNGDWDYDIALVTLDRRIGDNTGWLGYGYDNNDANLTVSLNSAGYPGDLNAPNFTTHHQYRAFDPITSITTHQLRSNQLDIMPGNSGGPVWKYISSPESRTVYGICSHQNASYNAWTRITSDKFTYFQNSITADATDRPPTDRPDLVDYDEWFNTNLDGMSSNSVYPGQNFSVTCYPRNNGTASAGSFTVSYYASTNDIISTGDTFLGSTVIGSLGEFNWTTASWSGAFPSLAPGNYYVGWIIDSGGAQAEFLEGNNTGQVRTSLLTVTAPPDDNYEQNDTLATAYDLSLNELQWLSSINGVGRQFDDDWYRIDVTPGFQNIQVNLTFTHAQGDIDIALIRPDGTTVTGSYGIVDNESINTLVPTAGTYYLRVYYGNKGNQYDLQWDDAASTDLSGASLAVTPGSVRAGNVVTVDYDVQNTGGAAAAASTASFYLSADATITTADKLLATSALPALGAFASTGPQNVGVTLPSYGDPFWIGDGGYYIGMIVDSGLGVAEHDESNNANRGLTLDTAALTVTATTDDAYEENDTQFTAWDFSLNPNTWISTIAGKARLWDDDYYRITIPANARQAVIDADFVHVGGDVDIYLYDSASNLVAFSNGVVDDEFISVTTSAPGDYFIRATYALTGNDYDLRWQALNADPTGSVPNVAVDEDSADTVLDLSSFFTDAEDGPAGLSYKLLSVTGAAVFASAGLSGNQLTLDYADNANGTATITVEATDTAGGVVVDAFEVTVNPVNDAPVLAPIGNFAVNEGSLLTFTATAGDPNDTPANGLAFSLVGAPAGAAIDATTGVFTWTPPVGYVPSSATFKVVVTDDGTPNLSAEEEITVTVNDTQAPTADVVVSGGASQRSMLKSFEVTFSEAVTFTGGLAAAITVERTGPGGPLGFVNLNFAQAGNVVTVTFDDATFAAGVAKSLIDGRYSIRLIAANIQGAGGPLDGDGNGTGGDDRLINTHRLYGDSDGDADVDASDYGLFRQTFGTGNNLDFDYDGDNDIDATDFGQFRLRFGTSV